MMPPFNFVFPTNRIAHFVEVSLHYLAQEVKLLVYIDTIFIGKYVHDICVDFIENIKYL